MRFEPKWSVAIRPSWAVCLCLAALVLALVGCDRFNAGQGRVIGTITVGGRATEGVKVSVYALDKAENDRDGSLLVRGALIQEATTTESGGFALTLPAGKYVVIPVDYKGISRLVEVKSGETTRADFQLQP